MQGVATLQSGDSSVKPVLSHLLVVEDDPVHVELLHGYFGKIYPSCRIEVAVNLAQGIELLKKKRYDFVIVDLNLPDSKGIETITALQAIASHVPMLVNSAIEDEMLAIQSVRLGAQDYLIKGLGNERTFKRIIDYSMERIKVQKKVQQNEEMLRTFIRHAPAGIVVLNDAFEVVMASERWREIYQLQNKDVVGRKLSTLVRHMDAQRHELYQKCLSGEHIECPQELITMNNGEQEYIRWEMMPWFNADAEIGGVIKFTEQISDRVRLQQELMQAKSELEDKVIERTQDANSALMAAESAQASKEEFFANITHELRTPLHAVINFSKFGVKKAETADREILLEYFSNIHKSGDRLLKLVNELLDLTKHKFGKTVLCIENVSVADMFTDIHTEVSAIMQTKELVWKQEIDAGCEWLECDRQRIYQVLINLVSNAIKFTGEQTQITVRARQAKDVNRVAAMNGAIVLSVTDQGVGIPEEELDSVFDEFTQSRKVQTGAFSGGTGLGLAICRQIVHAHNGLIWAENNSGGGATVSFTVPLGHEIEGVLHESASG